jgi:hypothetical protein
VQPQPLTDINHTWQFWVNGTRYTSSSGSTAGAFGNDGNRIGLDGLGDDPANCMMDDIRLYRRALSGQEISLLASRRGVAYETNRNRKYNSAAVSVAPATSQSPALPHAATAASTSAQVLLSQASQPTSASALEALSTAPTSLSASITPTKHIENRSYLDWFRFPQSL